MHVMIQYGTTHNCAPMFMGVFFSVLVRTCADRRHIKGAGWRSIPSLRSLETQSSLSTFINVITTPRPIGVKEVSLIDAANCDLWRTRRYLPARHCHSTLDSDDTSWCEIVLLAEKTASIPPLRNRTPHEISGIRGVWSSLMCPARLRT